jgi:4-alpha-glucanotransferase
LPLVAENLGLITKDVEKLRRKFKLPGMLVLQFAFDGNSDNPHLPHNHKHTDIIYTGTHDNDTTLGWYQQLTEEAMQQIRDYCFDAKETMPWLLIRLAFSSVGRLAIVPMQDFLELDGAHRMNKPGTSTKNWAWKFSWDQLDDNLPHRIQDLLQIYQRTNLKP